MPQCICGVLLLILNLLVPSISAEQQISNKLDTSVAWPKVQEGISFTNSNAYPFLVKFRVFEDGVEQPGAIVANDPRPASILVMVDVSTSMKPTFNVILNSVRTMIAAAQPEDEFAIITFSWQAFLEQSFTKDRTKLADVLNGLKFAGGSTALYDNTDAAIKQFGDAQHATKRAIVLFSDGLDITSRTYNEKKLVRILSSLTTPSVYIICPAPQSKKGVDSATRLSTASGGMTLAASRPDELGPEATTVIRIIDTMNLIEYNSSHNQADGRLHKIEIRFVPNSDAVKPNVVFRQRYYAPSQ